MAHISMTLSDPKGQFCCLNLSNSHTSVNIASTMKNHKAYVTCNLSCTIKNESCLRVTFSHMHHIKWWYYLRNGAIWRHCYYKSVAGSNVWPIKYCHFK